MSQTISQVIGAYRELLRAQEQARIAREALARTQELLEVNRAMIRAGRMAEFEIVQTEADVASQELNVEESTNRSTAHAWPCCNCWRWTCRRKSAPAMRWPPRRSRSTASRRSGPPCSSNRNTCNA